MPKKTAPERPSRFLTQEQAKLILEAYEIDCLLDNEEETDMLEQHNPDLLHAYTELQAIADGSD